MICRIKGFELEILIEEGRLPVLIVLDRPIFRSIVNSFYDNINGNSNNDVLIEDNNKKIINYSKELICIDEFFNIDFKSREIITSLFKEIEKSINVDVEAKNKIESEVKKLGKLLYQYTDEIDFEISFNQEISILNILKLYNFQIDVFELDGALDKLLTLINIYADFKISNVMVFVNLKSYFNINEIKEIYKSLIYKKVKYLCIETQFYDKIDGEEIYIIDEDLYEINYLK